MKIFINPGHGGTDSGACGCGLIERDVAYNIGNMTAQCLQAAAFDVKLFQRGGFYGDLDEICDTANYWDADLFLSIHCNAGGGTGAETYHYYDSDAGTHLARCIQRQLTHALPLADRGVKAADFWVLKHTFCTAVLIETAFIDCAHDAGLLVERAEDFARAISFGVIDFF